MRLPAGNGSASPPSAADPTIPGHLETVKRSASLPDSVRLDDRQCAGLSLFAGAVQFSIGMIIAEAVDPRYSVSENYISDLGVRAGAFVFNSSIIILGIAILATSWFSFRAFKDRILTSVVLLAGIGAVGVGIFNEAFAILHSLFSFITFFFAALAAIAAFRVLRPPFSYLSVLIGAGSLVALGLFLSKNDYLKLGIGGMERMIVYPVLTWAIGFGGYLLGTSHERPISAGDTAP
jgi:hypothetical membrane protein